METNLKPVLYSITWTGARETDVIGMPWFDYHWLLKWRNTIHFSAEVTHEIDTLNNQLFSPVRIWKLTRTKFSMIYSALVICYLSQIALKYAFFTSLTLRKFFFTALTLYQQGPNDKRNTKQQISPYMLTTRSVLIDFLIARAKNNL